jgi:sulfite reductase (NADPH) flavoprotein alpha-component
VETDGRAQNVALSTLHRGWTNFTYLVVEMQNALVNDQGLQSATTLLDEPRMARSPYKLQRGIETHERFLRSYLDAMIGEPFLKLWHLVRGMCAPDLDPLWIDGRIQRVVGQKEARLVEAATSSLKRQLWRVAQSPPQIHGPELMRLVNAVDDIFLMDRRFLERIKQVLREGLVLFERHERRTLDAASEELVRLAKSLPDVVAEYYVTLADKCHEVAWIPTEIPALAAQRTLAPAHAQMKTLVSTDYWSMEEDERRKVVILKRHAVAVDSIEELLAQNDEIIGLMPKVQDEFGIVIDMRQAPTRNDPEFEDAMGQLRAEIFRHYVRVAVLVSSDIGVLQVNRIGRNEGASTFATQNESEAVRFAAGG